MAALCCGPSHASVGAAQCLSLASSWPPRCPNLRCCMRAADRWCRARPWPVVAPPCGPAHARAASRANVIACLSCCLVLLRTRPRRAAVLHVGPRRACSCRCVAIVALAPPLDSLPHSGFGRLTLLTCLVIDLITGVMGHRPASPCPRKQTTVSPARA